MQQTRSLPFIVDKENLYGGHHSLATLTHNTPAAVSQQQLQAGSTAGQTSAE
jgi:hypothetical protein